MHRGVIVIVIVRQIRTKCRSRSGDTWAGCIYDDWEGTESTGASTRGRYRIRERGLNTDSTIPGRLAFHRQSGPSTTDRKVRVFPPSRLHAALLTPPPPLPHPLVAIMLVPRQLTVDRGSIAFHHSRPRGWRSSSFSTPRRAISSFYPDSKSLVLSSRPRRRHCEHRE